MSLHSVYNIIALVAFALGAAALVVAAILFVSQRLWRTIAELRKYESVAQKSKAAAGTPKPNAAKENNWKARAYERPSPSGGQGTMVLDPQPNAAGSQGTMVLDAQPNAAGSQGTMVLDTQPNAAGSRGTMVLDAQPNAADGTTRLDAMPEAKRIQRPHNTISARALGSYPLPVTGGEYETDAHSLPFCPREPTPRAVQTFQILKNDVVVHTDEVI